MRAQRGTGPPLRGGGWIGCGEIHAFYGEIGQGGGKIIIMVDEDGREANAHKNFHLYNYKQEFPTLPGTGKHPFS